MTPFNRHPYKNSEIAARGACRTFSLISVPSPHAIDMSKTSFSNEFEYFLRTAVLLLFILAKKIWKYSGLNTLHIMLYMMDLR